MKILVTGADGFVGSWLTGALADAGHVVVGTVRRGTSPPAWLCSVATVELELGDAASVARALDQDFDAVVHLAGMASGAEARRDPGASWEVNAAGTARVLEAAAERQGGGARFLLASTAEVYGAGPARPRVETDPPAPCSPYGASKLGAEVAALEVARRTGLQVIVARSFPHIGRGQDGRFVVPAFARRLADARRRGEREVPVGNLDPVRDVLHVGDVCAAYEALLRDGVAGETYNVAAGRAVSIRELFDALARLMGVDAVPVAQARLQRPADIPYLVGSADKLRAATGWRPRVSLEEALAEVADAQAD